MIYIEPYIMGIIHNIWLFFETPTSFYVEMSQFSAVYYLYDIERTLAVELLVMNHVTLYGLTCVDNLLLHASQMASCQQFASQKKHALVKREI